jgi:UPF0755 protein
MKLIKRLVLLGILLMALLAGWMAWFALRPLALPSTPFQFTVTPGTSLHGLAVQLKRAGMLSEALRFRMLGRVMGYAGRVQSGTYELAQPLTPVELYRKLARGEVVQAAILLVEGWNIRDVRQELARHPLLEHRLLDLTDREVLAEIGAEETHAEGLFFPDTYFFNPGSADIDILRRAYRIQQQKLREAWETRSPDLPYATPYEALVMASIIEKETGVAEERPLIAAVFVNRMKKGMRLQTDPTVIYGLGSAFSGNLRKADLQRDTPYNTYTHNGLPPTPIAMPGEGALRAALNPARSGALYFVSRGDGTHYFSISLDEHNRAVNRFQR